MLATSSLKGPPGQASNPSIITFFFFFIISVLFSILGKTSTFSESGKALEVSNQIRSMGGGGGCRSTRPHACLPVWERMLLRPPRPSFFSLLLWLGPLLGALALPLSRKCLGLSTCGPSSHILGVWAAYVGRLSYQGPLIINPEKPK